MVFESNTVFLVDDHVLVRRGLADLIEASTPLKVVGQAGSLEKALPLISKSRPTVVTMDLMLPGLSGTAAVRELLSRCPGTSILIVSARLDSGELHSLLKMGVLGYITKDAAGPVVSNALMEAAAGRSYLCPDSAICLARGIRENKRQSVDLSQRLQEVLEYIAAGKTTREIADEMILSPKTVEKYRSQILRKLDARNQIEAIQKAVELGLLSQQSRR